MRMGRHHASIVLFLCSCLLLSPLPVAAAAAVAAPSEPAGQPAAAPPEDPLGRSTPYGTVIGFIQAIDKDDYQVASKYLESQQTANKKEELARLLKVVLNRGLHVAIGDLSRMPEGNLDDGLSRNLERVGTASFGRESLDILLHRDQTADGPPIWLFSSQTLLGVPDAAAQLHATLGERIWPESFRAIRIGGFRLFIVINALVLIPLLLGMVWLLMRVLRRVLRPRFLRWFEGQAESEVDRTKWPMVLLAFSVLLYILAPFAVTAGLRIVLTSLARALVITGFTLLLVQLTKLAAASRIFHLRQAGLPGRIAAVELARWLMMALWVVAGLFLVARGLGINVTTAVAGLGVGGIAVAFAAQKTIENLFGTVTVISDNAIQIGDRCQIGTIDGWMENIGLRSSQIRTLDRSVVSIPNGQLAMMNLVNLQQRDKRLFRHIVRLRYESTADQVRHVLAEIRTMMDTHPKLEPPGQRQRTHMIQFGESSLDLEVYVHVLTQSEEEFGEIQEDLLLRIMNIVEASGTRLALPSQTTYNTRDAASQEKPAG